MVEKLQRDLTLLASPTASSDVPRRTLGYAYGLGGLLSIIPDRPLYVSYDISAKVLDMAIQVLKRAGEHDLQVAAVEVDVSWTIIASLMTLGPNFVQTYLSQLLVLWRNALPKPTSKDTTSASGRNPLEWSFLLHVRESALSAILCFLRHNSPVLVSLDVARRLSSLLNNALQFVAAFLAQTNDEQLDQPVASKQGAGLTLRVRESLLRRRIYQCFSSIGFAGITEATQSSLLQSTITLFASAEGYAGSPVQAAIVSSSGSFNSIWQSTDGYAYGLTYSETQIEGGEFADKNSDKDVVETYFDELVGFTVAADFVFNSSDTFQLARPILGSCEHDPLALWESRPSSAHKAWPSPPPPITSVVDYAIQLFSLLLPTQDQESAARAVKELVDSTRSPRLDRNAGRRAAVLINANIALRLALRGATSNVRQGKEALGNPKVTNILSGFLKVLCLEPIEHIHC